MFFCCSINNHQNLKFFWPNNTALLNSEYKYIYVNHNINIVGKLDAELPLATRHYGTINYNYEVWLVAIHMNYMDIIILKDYS